MTEKEFRSLIGKNVVVDYPFFNEVQQWDMRNFMLMKTTKSSTIDYL